MISGKKPHGYTIIEVMIVLLITGVLLTSVGGTLRGRQQQSQFTAGVREFEANLNTEINEVASGQYPGNGNWKCEATGSGVRWTESPSEQGTNIGCTFLGKVFHPYTNGTYDIYNIAALRQNPIDGREVKNLTEAKPSIVAKNTPTDLSRPEGRETSKIPYGLVVKKIVLTPETPESVSPITVPGIAFVTTLGNYVSNTNDLVSASQSVDVMPVCTSGLSGGAKSCSSGVLDLDNNPLDIISFSNAFSNYYLQDSLRNPQKIVICIAKSQSDTNSSAAIILGKNNSKLSTEVTFNPSGAGC